MDSSNKIVDAVPISADNIKKVADEAIGAPINIYVERVAAKVVLTSTTGIFDTSKTSSTVESDDKKVYVQLVGWELYNDYSNSYLIKNINATWTTDGLGLTWNDSPFYRSYWAQSQTTDINDSFSWSYSNEVKQAKGFKTDYGFAVGTKVDYTESNYTYCGENTRDWTVDKSKLTKVILKGQLMQKNGDGYKTLEMTSWYGNEYAGEENLKIAVANSLAYTLYFHTKNGEEDVYTSIDDEDIECVALDGYKVGFRLSTVGQGKIWYKYSSENQHELVGTTVIADTRKYIAATNEYLAAIEPALVYKNGMTYYFVDIQHLGNVKEKPAYYGVVRNHVYQIDIQSIKGYGSPVSVADKVINTPEYPEEHDASFVAAKINILSWKIVKQGVSIVQ